MKKKLKLKQLKEKLRKLSPEEIALQRKEQEDWAEIYRRVHEENMVGGLIRGKDLKRNDLYPKESISTVREPNENVLSRANLNRAIQILKEDVRYI